MTRRRFAVGRARTPLLGSRVLRGSAFRFELSEPARVTIRIERKLRGRRVGRSCRVKSRRGRRCSVYRRVGVLTRRSRQQGANRVPFSGRLGRKALAAGRYRATLRAFDAAGNRSAARRFGFTIVRR